MPRPPLHRLHLLGNLLANQLVWLVAVWGAARGQSWPGVLAAALFLALHLWVQPERGSEARFILVLSLVGYGLDCLWTSAQLAHYRPGGTGPWAPAWIAALWFSFAATVRHSLRPLLRSWPVAALTGLLGAPLAYLAASRTGAVAFDRPLLSLGAIGLAWALLLPALRPFLPLPQKPAPPLVPAGEGA
jgi:hypothetical protein